jgi:hypothetical protein
MSFEEKQPYIFLSLVLNPFDIFVTVFLPNELPSLNEREGIDVNSILFIDSINYSSTWELILNRMSL